ncbi:MAG: hypothetical protein IPP33_17035 [Flavobacteriales bacterium]|nr:hypothetical protein [Flavobacteriales bacterium]
MVDVRGIYAPDANTRWMGSMAMDNNGSIGITYLKSNSRTIYPGLYYTGRRTCDPSEHFLLPKVLALLEQVRKPVASTAWVITPKPP